MYSMVLYFVFVSVFATVSLFVFFLMIRLPPRSTLVRSSAASDVYKRQVLKEGDCVLFDMGCVKDRYCSDMTRTWFCGQPTEKQAAVHDLVRRANEAAEALIKPGVRLCDLDAAARDLITEAGYGEYFNHRLGHFIGRTDHEKGDVSSANTAVAKPGMIFSIEPGVYLPGEFGVRVEDLVLVTEGGCEVLNHNDKHWDVMGK